MRRALSRTEPRPAYSAAHGFGRSAHGCAIATAPLIVALFVIEFRGHDYWATALLAIAVATDWVDGRVARRSGRPSAMGSLLDPVADKILVLAVLIVLVERGVFAGWMVAAIVALEFLVSA